MRKQNFRLPPWRRKPTADETAPDIADSELVPSESAAQPTRRKHGKRTYVIGGVLLALAIAAAVALPGAVDTDDGAGGASTTLARPDGDPSGQSAEDNIYITTGDMDQETYRSETVGQTKAKVGFIDYNQNVHNVRVVTSDSVFTEAISTSMFVKLGEQKYFKDGAILVRKASSVTADSATWSDQIVAISQQDYQDAYGQDPRNLSNYVISQDTVQNPTMTANDDGTYTLTFDLEPAGASAYYKHQVRTYSGASKNPEFTAVHMVWTIDANWDLLQMDTVESYSVSMSGLGSLNCTSTLTETFTDFGAVTDDQTEFQHYLATQYGPNNLGKLSDGGQDTQAMVRDFFRRTPNYSITVSANGQSYGLTAHMDIDQTTFQLRGNVAGVDLFAAYSNERVYIAFGSQKITLRASDTLDAARTVAGYLGVQIPDISLDSAGMAALTKNVTMQETANGMNIRLNDPMISGTVQLTDPDALRLTLVVGSTPGNDMRFSDEKVKASRNFANKLWNAARFVMMNLPEDFRPGLPASLTMADKWVLSQLNTLVKNVTENLDKFELGLAAQKVQDFIWDVYCDWYIEIAKLRLNSEDAAEADSARQILVSVLVQALKLLHPFMPFITEEIYTALPGASETLMLEKWPEYEPQMNYAEEEAGFEKVMDLIKAVRTLRADMGVHPAKRTSLIIETADKTPFEDGAAYLAKFAFANEVSFTEKYTGDTKGVAQVVTHAARAFIPMLELIDREKEQARLAKEKAQCEKEIASMAAKLSNEGFVNKAPAHIVEDMRQKHAAAAEKLAKIEESIRNLG